MSTFLEQNLTLRTVRSGLRFGTLALATSPASVISFICLCNVSAGVLGFEESFQRLVQCGWSTEGFMVTIIFGIRSCLWKTSRKIVRSDEKQIVALDVKTLIRVISRQGE